MARRGCVAIVVLAFVVIGFGVASADVVSRGDVDKNGVVDARDAIVALQIGSGLVLGQKEYYDEFFPKDYPNKAVIVYEDGTTLSLPSPGWQKSELIGFGVIDITGVVYYVEYDGLRIATDTSSDRGILKQNFRVLGIDPAKIDVLVISHGHFDHFWGFKYFLTQNPDIYIFAPMSKEWMLENDPSYPPPLTEDMLSHYFQLQDDFVMLTDRVCVFHTPTGDDDFPPVHKEGEVSIALLTPEGLVINGSCAHPDVNRIVRRAKKITQENRVYMYIGGTEFVYYDEFTISWLIDLIKQEGVERIAACHCTGRPGLNMLQAAWGDNFINAVTGTVIDIPTW